MKSEIEKLLQQEREKLNRLVDAALENGTPIEETYDIMDQCRKISRFTDAQRMGAVLRDAAREQGHKVEELIAQREGVNI